MVGWGSWAWPKLEFCFLWTLNFGRDLRIVIECDLCVLRPHFLQGYPASQCHISQGTSVSMDSLSLVRTVALCHFPLLQMRKLRPRAMRYLSKTTECVRDASADLPNSTPARLTHCRAEPIPECSPAFCELEQVAVTLVSLSPARKTELHCPHPQIYSKDTRAFSLLCLSTVYMLCLALLL